MPKKKSHKEFIEEQKIKNPNLIFLSQYDGNKTPIKTKCIVCNYVWNPYPCHLSKTKHSGCPRCAGRAPYTPDEYKTRLKNDNPTIKLLEDYVNSSTSIKFKCLKCGHIWKSTPGHLIGKNPHGCKICNNKKAGMRSRKPYVEFITKLKKNNPNVEVISKYISMSRPIKVRCKICGHEWTPKASGVALGTSRCVDCGNKHSAITRTRKPEEFAAELKKVHPDYKIIRGYTHNKVKVLLQCSHGHKFETNPYDVLRGHGCPKCAHNGTSFTEKFLLYAFRSVFGTKQVLDRNRKLIGKEIDILIPEHKIAIEYGSWYWHKNKVKNDLQKQKLCVEKGYTPITIYDFVDNKKIKDRDKFVNLYLFKHDLASESTHQILKELVNNLLSEFFNIEPIENFNSIEKLAAQNSLPVSTEDFKKKLSAKHKGFKVKGEYLGSKIYTKIVCPKGHILDVTPNQVLHDDYRCKECAKDILSPRKMTKNVFLQRLKKDHPNIVLLGKYSGIDIPTKFKCNECNQTRTIKPSRVLYSKYGCNNCARKHNGKNCRKSHEEFVKELYVIKPDIEVIGHYEKSTKKVLVKCKKCGNKWEALPGHLLEKGKKYCPKCSLKKNASLNKKKIRCLENGKEYIGASDTDKIFGYKEGTIARLCRTKKQSTDGYHFTYL